MVPNVRKNLKPTQFISLENFSFNNFSKKSIPGQVWAQVLQEPVSASHADQGWQSRVLNQFSDPGGQEESSTTPHLPLACLGTLVTSHDHPYPQRDVIYGHLNSNVKIWVQFWQKIARFVSIFQQSLPS